MAKDIAALTRTYAENTERQQRQGQTQNSSPSNNNKQPPSINPPDERLCATCWGLGFISPPPTGNIPSQSIPCPDNCNTSSNQLKLKQNSQIKGDRLNWFLRGSSFPREIQPQIKRLVEILYSDTPAGFWYLHGPNGCGKTYIITAAINEAIRQQRSGLYTTAIEMLNALRKTFSSDDNQAESRLISQIKRTTVVSIDEYGRHRDSEYSAEVLFNIMDDRYQSAHNYHEGLTPKLTLISSNLKFNKLEPWLQSRLQDRNAHIINMSQLPDRRKMNK